MLYLYPHILDLYPRRKFHNVNICLRSKVIQSFLRKLFQSHSSSEKKPIKFKLKYEEFEISHIPLES